MLKYRHLKGCNVSSKNLNIFYVDRLKSLACLHFHHISAYCVSMETNITSVSDKQHFAKTLDF